MSTSETKEGAVGGPGVAGAGAPADSAPPAREGPHLFGSLRFRLILLVLLSTGPAFGVVLNSGLERRAEALQEAEASALAAAQAIARAEEAPLDRARSFLNAVALLPPVRDLDVPACGALLPRLLARETSFHELGLLNSEGKVLCRAGLDTSAEDVQGFFARTLQARRFTVGRPVAGKRDEGIPVRVGHPILDAGGAVRAVLYVSVDLLPLEEASRRIHLPPGYLLRILDETGNPLDRAPKPPGGAGAGDADPIPRSEGAMSVVGQDGVARRVGFAPLRSGGDTTGIVIAVGLPERAVTAPAEADLLRSMIVVGSVGVAALLASWLFGGWLIMNRVNGLLKATRRLSTGDIRARRRPRDNKGGELGELERSFDDMALSLETRTVELQRAEARYREIVEAIPAAFYVAPEGDEAPAEYVSPRMQALTGYPPAEWLSRPGLRREIVDPEDRERVGREVDEALEKHGTYEVEYRLRRSDGGTVWVRDRGAALPGAEGRGRLVRGFLVDVTDRKDLEKQFLQAQKMEALGRLSASVAHDFNNLLTVMSGYGQLLQARFGSDAVARGQLEEITRAADRASVLTRQLLHFSRRQGSEPVILDLNEAVNSLDRMVRRLIGERIEVRTSLGPALRRVRIDRGHVDQLVMNLVVNARDAMPDGGTLEIRTENADVDEEAAKRRDGARAGPHACLVVADTGCGMDETVRGRAFEPFFTTKGEGKGTGLGLSTVYGIVRQARGHVVLESEPGRGTTFRIFLPRHEGDDAPKGPADAGPEAPGRTRTLALLVLEDQETVRHLARQCLEADGHSVATAASIEEARREAERLGATLDGIVADLSLPDGDGAKLARELAAERPGLVVVLMSGFSRVHLREEGRETETEFVFLPKPFRPADLRDAIARAAARAEGGAAGARGAEAGT